MIALFSEHYSLSVYTDIKEDLGWLSVREVLIVVYSM